METITLVLNRATAIRIYKEGIDEAAKAEVLGGAITGDGQAVAITLDKRTADRWFKALESPATVDRDLAIELDGAFALALGEHDDRWTVRKRGV